MQGEQKKQKFFPLMRSLLTGFAAYVENAVYSIKIDTADFTSWKSPNVFILNQQFLCHQRQLGWGRSLRFQNWPLRAESINSVLLDPLDSCANDPPGVAER